MPTCIFATYLPTYLHAYKLFFIIILKINYLNHLINQMVLTLLIKKVTPVTLNMFKINLSKMTMGFFLSYPNLVLLIKIHGLKNKEL
jgi:hypothetical protein